MLFELKPDFALAQARLMRSTQGLRRRMLGYESAQVPKAALARLGGGDPQRREAAAHIAQDAEQGALGVRAAA